MIKLYLNTLLAMLLCALGLNAQVTSTPTPLQEDSQDVYIYFYADQGNKKLEGVRPPERVFAHTGVITNKSTSPSDWKYATPSWGDNSAKYEMEWVSANLWKLYIGNIRDYYGITDPNEVVEQLAFVFRNQVSTKEGKTATGGDILLDVVSAGLQVTLQAVGIDGQIINGLNNSTTFVVSCTTKADLTLSVNGTKIGEAKGSNALETKYTFATPGDYEVTATAVANGETKTAVNSYCYVEPAKQMAYPGGGTPVMGPVKNADGSVTFCLAAPEKTSVILVGAWNDYKVTNAQNMYYTDVDGFRYFWSTVNGLDNDTMYGYYFITEGSNGTVRVGDPYARLVLDPYNDKYLITDVFPDLPPYPYQVVTDVPVAIYQGSINDYDWKVKNFKGVDPSNLIIYELLFRDFTGTEGEAKGNGTVQLALEKLPYLKELGVNAIEVLPITEFSGNDSWGYNPNFYFAVDKAYGTPDDYKEFIDVCHQNGIAVILDLVFNQSDGLHPWYQMYGGIENSPFYNNYKGLGENGSPHAYSVFNDWNQDYPLVQQQWKDVITYWLTEYKFDGFRFDLVKGLGKNDSYFSSTNIYDATNAYNASRVAEMRYLQGIVESINPNAYFINENLAGEKEENEMAETGQMNWANVNDEACQFAMGWSTRSNMNRLYAPDDSRLWGSTVSYLESHDEERLAYKQEQWGDTGIKGNPKTSMQRIGSAAAQMIMSPGAHMIWQFSEMGNAQSTKNSDNGNNTDKKIVNWNLLNEPNHKGLYDSYCELIAIRNNNSDMFAETVDFQMACGQNNWANGRYLMSTKGNSQIITAINPNVSGSPITMRFAFAVADNSAYKVLSKSYDSNPSFDAVNGTITIPANCYVTIGTQGIDTGIDEVNDSSSELRAYGAYGEIVIDYAPNGASVYSLDGALIGTVSEKGRFSVGPGMYIVKSAGQTIKMIVK